MPFQPNAQLVSGTKLPPPVSPGFAIVGFVGNFAGVDDPALDIGWNVGPNGARADTSKGQVLEQFEGDYFNAGRHYQEWIIAATSIAGLATRPISFTIDALDPTVYLGGSIQIGGTGNFAINDANGGTPIFQFDRASGQFAILKASASLVFSGTNPAVQATAGQSLAFITNGHYVWADQARDGITFGVSQDADLYRTGANVLKTDGVFTTGKGATGARPNATTVGEGAQWYDTTLHKPIWADNAGNWRDASGAIV